VKASRRRLELAVRNSKKRFGNNLKKYERTQKEKLLKWRGNNGLAQYQRNFVGKKSSKVGTIWDTPPPSPVRARLLQGFFSRKLGHFGHNLLPFLGKDSAGNHQTHQKITTYTHRHIKRASKTQVL
jgi:hypothetical protein